MHSKGPKQPQSHGAQQDSPHTELPGDLPSLNNTSDVLQNDSEASAEIAAVRRYLALGDLKEAALRANLALTSFPANPELNRLASEILQRIEHRDKFRRLISEAERHRKAGNWKLAIEHYQSARELEPESKLARIHMAKSYAEWARELLSQDPDTAQKLIETSLHLDADNPDVKQLQLILLQQVTKQIVDRALIQARELRARGELVAADLELRSALQKAPENAVLRNSLTDLPDEEARETNSQRDPAKTEKVVPESALSQILSLEAQDTVSALKQALQLAEDGLRRAGDHALLSKARNQLERRLKERQEELDALLLAVKTNLSRGEYDAAKTALQNASVLDPDNPQCQELQEQLNKARIANVWTFLTERPTRPGQNTVAAQPTDRIRVTAGQVLADRYEILTHLGTGGMSAVYKARDMLVDQPIALKIVLPSISRDSQLRNRFKREMLVARKLTHPNVVRIFDIGEHQGLLFISMELLEGQTVADVLSQRKRFTIEQFLTLFNEFTSALGYIHSQQVLHRDIKPQNLMYDKGGNVKVMDFGIARDMAVNETTLSIALGTPAYMSPELLAGETLTPASDIYSAGLLFYELLTGTRVFTHGSLHERREKTVPRLSQLVQGIPHDIDEMVFRCLQSRPQERFQSVFELVAAITDKQQAHEAEPSGSLADFVLDTPASVLEVVPLFVRTVQQLASIYNNPSCRAILTPKTIQWTRDNVQIKVVSGAEAQHTRAVDCKYASFEDFNEVTPGGTPRVESDIYVLGLIFYEILLGQNRFRSQFAELYKGDWNLQWLHWHSDLAKTAKPLREILTDIPPALSDTIENMMQKSAERRPSLAAVQASLTSVLEHAQRELTKTVVLKRQRQSPKRDTSRRGLRLAALLFVIFLAAAVWIFLKGRLF
jgi:serine/threonine protein kinase